MNKSLKANPQNCSLCNLCALVCSKVQVGYSDPAFSGIRISHELPAALKVKLTYCLQCKQGYCIKSCPYQALVRDEQGIVRLARDKCHCTEIRPCVEACKFKAIYSVPLWQYPIKCDMCQGSPRCVQVCPSGALRV
ncbi:4Fe-4S dicluster domain-containing protein [Moorella stamsii]|uniref:4Fe-4S dicluster domain-containing protein n=1 Tax=Neomoorella stamsii TaxID=1266720 RepID=UPI00137A4A23